MLGSIGPDELIIIVVVLGLGALAVHALWRAVKRN